MYVPYTAPGMLALELLNMRDDVCDDIPAYKIMHVCMSIYAGVYLYVNLCVYIVQGGKDP